MVPRFLEPAMYEYSVELIRVIDGDTVHLMIDLGLDVKVSTKCRLFGINAPEMNTQAGKDAKAFLAEQLARRDKWTANTIKDKREKYGRYLVSLTDPLGVFECVNDSMIQAGHAVRYMAI